MSTTTAQEISTRAIQALSDAGITLSDAIKEELPAVTQLLIALSRPVRSQIRAFLSAQEGKLLVAKAKAVSETLRANVLADKINAYGGVVSAMLAPVDRALSIIPLDSAVKESKTLSDFLKSIADSVPIRIPATQATVIAGIGGFDFFEGVTSYRDLRDKVDELFFRAARATAVSTYAQTASFLVDEQLDKIRAYIEVIDTLDFSTKSISVSPSSLDFGSVAVGSESYLGVGVSNNSSSPAAIYGSFLVTGDGFSLGKSDNVFALSTPGASFTGVVKFSPTATGSVLGTVSIAHNASNVSSPITVNLTGIGI